MAQKLKTRAKAAKSNAREKSPSLDSPPQVSPKSAPLSLADQAYAAIKEHILTLYFQPGQFLNGNAICELVGLGRTPVHQALQRLHNEKLLEIVPRKGVIVQPDTVPQILDIIDARMVVEGELARRAAEHAVPADVVELKRIIERTDHEHGGGSIDAFVERDREFHTKIAAMSASPTLTEVLRTLHERSTRFWYLHLWQTLDRTKASKEHNAVISAIERRDGAGAAQAMRRHLEALRLRLEQMQANAPRRGFHRS